MTLVFHPQFETDLREISDYIAKDSPPQAIRVAEKIVAECTLIANYPKVFRERPDIRRGLRMAHVGKYAIIFTIAEDSVHILRVFHGMRNLPSYFH